MQHVVHVSGGRTSMYIAYEMLGTENAIFIFQNTGREREETYEFLDRCDKAFGLNLIWLEYQKEPPFYRVVSFETASRDSKPFDDLIEKRHNYLPNRAQRFCTQELKVLTAYRYIRKELKLKEWTNYVGIRYDEPHRDRPETRESKTIKQYMRYPLFEQKQTALDVKAFWESGNIKPLDLKLPLLPNGKTVGGNCVGCFLKGEYENVMLCRNEPEKVKWLLNKEKQCGATFENGKSWQDRMDLSINNPMFDFDGAPEELLCQNDYGSCSEF